MNGVQQKDDSRRLLSLGLNITRDPSMLPNASGIFGQLQTPIANLLNQKETKWELQFRAAGVILSLFQSWGMGGDFSRAFLFAHFQGFQTVFLYYFVIHGSGIGLGRC